MNVWIEIFISGSYDIDDNLNDQKRAEGLINRFQPAKFWDLSQNK